jgi:RNA polymerase sigma-70 factor (sigma-E family)
VREQAFHAFFERHHAELSRLAYLLTGDSSAADEVAADGLTEVWRHWDRVNAAADPVAYVRGIVANLSRNWVRRQARARLFLLGASRPDLEPAVAGRGPDVAAILDVRAALRRLPHRRRACVVLRYAFDLSEREVADILDISVGAVKSQTSRGARQLAGLLPGVSLPEGWEVAR